MTTNDTHPSESAYLAGYAYAVENVILLTESEVRGYASCYCEDTDAFCDGYWNTKHREG